jgi:hypothetical protein
LRIVDAGTIELIAHGARRHYKNKKIKKEKSKKKNRRKPVQAFTCTATLYHLAK